MAQIADFITTASDLEKKKKMGQFAIAPETMAKVPGLSSIGVPETTFPQVTFEGQAREDGTQAYPFNQNAQESPSAPQATPTIPEVQNGLTGQSTAIPQGEAGSPQANFAARMASGQPLTEGEIAQANEFARSMGTTFNPETGYDRQPFLNAQNRSQPQGGNTMSIAETQARLAQLAGQPAGSRMTLNQYLTGNPNAIMGTDFQGRMRSFESPEARQQNLREGQAFVDAQSMARQQRIGGTGSYEGDSAAREARIAARPDFNEAVSDRDRRGTGEMSMAAATRMMGGNRRAARALIERQRQGMGEFAEPRDNRTPEQIEEDQLRNDLLRAQIERMNEPNATAYDKKIGQLARMREAGEITPEEYDAAVKRERDRVLGIKEEDTKQSATDAVLSGGGQPKETYSDEQESMINKVMGANPNATREDVIKALKEAGRL